jgi:hypothetical protein
MNTGVSKNSFTQAQRTFSNASWISHNPIAAFFLLTCLFSWSIWFLAPVLSGEDRYVFDSRRDLVHVMIQEVGVDMAAKGILWVKARPDYEPLFSILDSLRLDGERRYWIERRETEGNISDIEVDTVQMSTGVEILLPMSHNTLTIAEEYIK